MDILESQKKKKEYNLDNNIKYYRSHSGEKRRWKYPDGQRPKGKCYDCRRPYGKAHWVDVIVDDDLWELINPTYHKGCGLLCGGCIVDRLDVVLDHTEMTHIKMKAEV